MVYRVESYRSVSEVNAEDWNRVHACCGDPFSDLRFLSVVETSLAESTVCAPTIVYDGIRPVAIAAISAFPIDGSILAPGPWQRAADAIRLAWPGYLRFRMAFCGLPTMISPRPLWVMPGADRAEATGAVADRLEEIAASSGIRLVAFSDSDAEDEGWPAALLRRGYVRLPALPANRMTVRHASFAEYLGALRSSYRRRYRQVERRFRSAGLRIEHRYGQPGVAALLSDDLYRFYEQLVHRSTLRTMVLPKAFFAEFARQFHRELLFSRVFHNDSVIAFQIGLICGGVFTPLFLAVAPQWHREAGVYPFLAYSVLEFALDRGISFAEWGGTVDDFKHRLGCHQTRRCAYVRVRGALGPVFRVASRLFARESQLLPPSRIFRSDLRRPARIDFAGAAPSEEGKDVVDHL